MAGHLRNGQHPRATLGGRGFGGAGHQVEHHGDFVARMALGASHAIGPNLAGQSLACDDAESTAFEKRHLAGECDDACEFAGGELVGLDAEGFVRVRLDVEEIFLAGGRLDDEEVAEVREDLGGDLAEILATLDQAVDRFEAAARVADRDGVGESRADPSAWRAMACAALGSRVTPSAEATLIRCALRSSMVRRRKSKRWQRPTMVAGILCGSVVASTNRTPGGGSSNTFSSASNASRERRWASSMM